MKISISLFDRVKEKLTATPAYRDDMGLLATNIWKEDIEQETGFPARMISYEHFEKLYISGKLSNAISIRRYWQVLQRKYPELRGKMWEERHGYAEKVSDHLKEVVAA